MEHFDAAQWTDFVRGVGQPAQREAMEQHLAGGCADCANLAALLARVYQEARDEAAVPEHLVRSAAALFRTQDALPLPAEWWSLPRVAARLTFSSLAEPAPEGARSAAEAVAQATYTSNGFTVDLQLDREPESAEISVIGQVSGASPAEALPVVLVSRKSGIAHAKTNCFGEFCLTGRMQPGLQLWIVVDQESRRIVIPLAKLVTRVL